MGCTSSTEIRTDPFTGKETKKKTLGGAYPGQRRPQHQPYAPPPEAFQGQGTQAAAHFVSYGGGNALVLANADGTAMPPASGGKPKEYIQVTLPNGVKAGDTIHVQAPSGKTNAIVIPNGFGPGDSFTVEFAEEIPAAKTGTFSSSAPAPAAAYNPPPANYSDYNNDDDGFATGFGQPTTATAVHQQADVHAYHHHPSSNEQQNAYPSATATPVYTPQYASPPRYS